MDTLADRPVTPVHRAMARVAWVRRPGVGLTYRRADDALVADLLDVPTVVDHVEHGLLCVGRDGADAHALPTVLVLVGFRARPDSTAAACARDLLGHRVWRAALALPADADAAVEVVLDADEARERLALWTRWAPRPVAGVLDTVHEALSGACPVAVVGRTDFSALLSEYTDSYAHAYPGGIHRSGPLAACPETPIGALGRYLTDLHRIAAEVGVRVDGASPARVRRAIAGAVDAAALPVLWIVEDVPPPLLTPGELRRLLVPSQHVRTLLTGVAASHDIPCEVIVLDPQTDRGDARPGESRAAASAAAEAIPRAETLAMDQEHRAEALAFDQRIGVAPRVALLRALAGRRAERGQSRDAAALRGEIARLCPGDVDALLAASAAHGAAGADAESLRAARAVLSLESARADHIRRARVLAARACDRLGEHAEADDLCWSHECFRADRTGAGPDAVAFRVGLATGLRLRGRPAEALRVLAVDLPAAGPAAEIPEPGLVEARLEYARSALPAGEIGAAIEAARSVISHHERAGLFHHRWFVAARCVFADARLACDLAARTGVPDPRRASLADLEVLYSDYGERHGERSLLTLTAAVWRCRALVAGAPAEALAGLRRAGDLVRSEVGDGEPLWPRLRHGIAEALRTLGKRDEQRAVLTEVLAAQRVLLGRRHAETMATVADLAELGLSGDPLGRQVHHQPSP
ncbi:hypothetical protein [Actinokineospora iranica]|uniref:hypothetical protein n=1 Tax=Actinokineospora iranica TaxID=1271860 RepID=UPI00111413EC|nr:hypothetical protein [Actinokineospora iranica]